MDNNDWEGKFRPENLGKEFEQTFLIFGGKFNTIDRPSTCFIRAFTTRSFSEAIREGIKIAQSRDWVQMLYSDTGLLALEHYKTEDEPRVYIHERKI